MAIRGDAQLKGIKVVTGEGGEETEVRERCMADDTVVYLESRRGSRWEGQMTGTGLGEGGWERGR